METTTANLTNTSSANSTTNQPNFAAAAAALNAFNNFNHNNAAAAAGLLARLSASRHLNSLNNNSTASTPNMTNGSTLNNNPLNPFTSSHFAANLAAAAAISPYSLPNTYADFYHNFNLLNQQQQQQTSSLNTDTSTNSNSPILNNAQTTNQTASLINQTAGNGLYSIDNLLSPSMLSSANLIAQLSNGTIPAQFAKNSSLESVLREAAENGLKQKKGNNFNLIIN